MDPRSSNKGLLAAEPTSYASSPSDSELTEAQMVGVPQPGDEILGGKYAVEHVIGVGGMGVVVAALHKKLGQRVAIKFLSRHMQTSELVDRFIREGQACARIKSEHIASVLDVGLLENGTPYLMMEYLEGIDLDDYINEHGAIPMDDAVNFVLQACDALAVAHSAGIVHRDLKPSNLFVTQRSDGSPLIKVLDFGISKIGQSDLYPNPKSSLTRPGTMLGSPRYVSPEQLRNASNVDHRADIWAIGIVLHELVVGVPPYVADSFADLCAMITTHAPTPLRELVLDAPEALEASILKCIEKNPDDRFQTVAELANALAPIASEESRAIAVRVGKILEVASSRSPNSLYPPRSTGSPPRYSRANASGSSGSGRLAPTVARSGPRSGNSSMPTDPHASALSVSGKTFARGWRTRVGGIALLLGLVAAIVTLVMVVYRSRAVHGRAIVAPAQATMPPPPPPTALASVAPEASVAPVIPPVAPAPLVLETMPTPPPTAHPAPAKPVVSTTPKTTPVKAAAGKTKAPTQTPPSAAAPPVAPAPQNESDMLNRRR